MNCWNINFSAQFTKFLHWDGGKFILGFIPSWGSNLIAFKELYLGHVLLGVRRKLPKYNNDQRSMSHGYFFGIRSSSCCWIYGLKRYSSSSWNVEALISLQKTYNGRAYKINTPPQISHIPIIQHNLSSSYFGTGMYVLPVYDPDNDLIKCRWAANFSEGGGVWNSRTGIESLSSVCIYFAIIL